MISQQFAAGILPPHCISAIAGASDTAHATYAAHAAPEAIKTVKRRPSNRRDGHCVCR